jgi:dTDP-4-dehydrorhamnose reductase
MVAALQHAVVVGASGMLGRAFVELLDRRGVACTTRDMPALDLTAPATLDALDLRGVDVVVNCSGWTDVDGAEADEAAAVAVNATGVGALGERCRQADVLLVHVSTDYVFGGDARVPYPVDAPLAPLGAYGRSKAAGESRLQATRARHLLVRTSWLYAPWGKNFVLTIAGLARSRDSLRVVDDQRGRPTSAEHLAAATLALVEAGESGAWHVTDGGECTWFELARHVAARVAPGCRVEPCTTAEFPRPAPRPAYSVLDVSRTEALLGAMPPWPGAVDGVLARAGAASLTRA